jgi:hypothetical protein
MFAVRIKAMGGLWSRQILGGLEVLYHLVLASWTFTHRDDAPRNEGPWAEAGAAHCMHALAFVLCILAEEHYHRSSSSSTSPLKPLVLWLFYAASLASGLYVAALAMQQLPSDQVVRLAATWNVVPLGLLPLLSLWSWLLPPVAQEYGLPPTPEMEASLLSYTMYFWFWPVIATGLRKVLDVGDLPALPEHDLSAQIWEAYRPLVQPLEETAMAVGQEQRKRRSAEEGEGEEEEAREHFLRTPTVGEQAASDKKTRPEGPHRCVVGHHAHDHLLHSRVDQCGGGGGA